MKYLLVLLLIPSCNKPLPENALMIPVFSNEKQLISYTYYLSKTNPYHAVLVISHHTNLLAKSTRLQSDLVTYLRESGCFARAIHIGTNIINKKFSPRQKAKLNFLIAESFAGLDDYDSAKIFFEESIKFKNYFYYYSYAQVARQAKDFNTAYSMYNKAFAATDGKKDFINRSFANFLVEEAIFIHKKDPQKAKQNLERVINTPELSISSIDVRAEILYKQWGFN